MQTNWSSPRGARCGAAALVLLGAAVLPEWAGAYALNFSPASQTVGLGSEVTMAVTVSGVQPGGLGSYDLTVNYDATVLAFDRAIDALGLGLAIGLGVTPLPNALLVSDFSLEPIADLLALQPDGFTLFSLVFDTVSVGASPLDMAGITLSDAAGAIVTATAGTGSVTVQAATGVPEPAGWALAGLALAACLGAGRRSPAIKG